MYIFGGYMGTENRHLNDLHEFDPGTSCWRLLKPYGSGPSPRRRQCAIVIASRVFLFGGTMPCKSSKAELINNGLSNLSDLHVLDYAPSLKDLSAAVVIQHGFHEMFADLIPFDLQYDIRMMSQPNTISLTRYGG